MPYYAFCTLLYPFVQELDAKTLRKKEKQRICAKVNSPRRACSEEHQRGPTSHASSTPQRAYGEPTSLGEKTTKGMERSNRESRTQGIRISPWRAIVSSPWRAFLAWRVQKIMQKYKSLFFHFRTYSIHFWREK